MTENVDNIDEKKKLREDCFDKIKEIYPDLIFLGGKLNGEDMDAHVLTEGRFMHQCLLLARLMKISPRLFVIAEILASKDKDNEED